MSQPLFTNRLISEKSPYLLQHAHNPVDWYPWGEEAFNAARMQGKPIFLSIGYATCHWCHVMENESFSSIEIGQLMNETFINIKIDREEQPEVDGLYMEFAQAMMTGGAGWPLNVILTADLMPFFASTYLPADSRDGHLGMKQLILRIRQIWNDVEERELVIAQAGKIVNLFAEQRHAEGDALPEKEEIEEAAEIIFKAADPIYGGMRGAPKFPIGYQACFLLRYSKQSSESRALFYIERTLQMMYRGGIYDHLGGGFSRYSVDEKWIIPHFEKMLYDNAILARAYLETWEFTHDHFYRACAEDILGYLLREMRSPSGAFYSAEDADVNDHEGQYYTWSWQEIHSILGTQSPLFCEFYGVTPTGNFEGKNVLHMSVSFDEFAKIHHLDPTILFKSIEECKSKLLAARQTRPLPAKDDKVITAWNGLMLYALAHAARALNNKKYLEAAKETASFIKQNLWKEGSLLRRYREGEARFEGCLDDYAFLIHGLLTLFEADGGSEWCEFAIDLTNVLTREFKAPQGAFYFTNGKDPHLLLRSVEFYDGAEPSGNAIHAENLIRLYEITGAEEFRTQAEEVLKAAREHIEMYPPGACYHLMALDRFLDPRSATLVVSLNSQEEHREEILKMLSGRFLPHVSVIFCRESDEVLRDLSAICRDKPALEGKTTLYLCRKGVCEKPLTQISEIWQAIDKI